MLSNKLFVGGLSWGTEALGEVFVAHGEDDPTVDGRTLKVNEARQREPRR